MDNCVLKDIKVEAVDQTVSMLIKSEPCSDQHASLASKSPEVIVNHQAGSVSSVKNQTGPNCKSSSFIPIKTSESPVVNSQHSNQAGSLNSVEKTQKGSNVKSPVADAQHYKQAGSLNSVENTQKGINVKSTVVNTQHNKQAGSLNYVENTQKSSNDISVSPEVAIKKEQQAALNSNSRLVTAVNNQASYNDASINKSDVNIQDGECSTKPIVLNQATATTTGSDSNSNAAPSPTQSQQQQLPTKKQINEPNSPPPSPSPSPSVEKCASLALQQQKEDEAYQQKEEEAYKKSNNENLVIMQSMLHNLKAKMVSLTLQLVADSSKSAELSNALFEAEKQIDYVKRSIKSLRDDLPLTNKVDEDYKRLHATLKLVPYFQWEGNVTNKKEKVFLTLYACLRQVERAAKECDFDIETKWVSLISTKLSTKMHRWLDNLLIRLPNCSWTTFKTVFIQEYEMPLDQALKIMIDSEFNPTTQTINGFVNRFLMAFEYSKISETYALIYFMSALPTAGDRNNFTLLCDNVKKNHMDGKGNIYRAIELYRDIHNQSFGNSYWLEKPAVVHNVSPPLPQEIKIEKQAKRCKNRAAAAPYNKKKLHCINHPKARSHTTENCKINQA